MIRIIHEEKMYDYRLTNTWHNNCFSFKTTPGPILRHFDNISVHALLYNSFVYFISKKKLITCLIKGKVAYTIIHKVVSKIPVKCAYQVKLFLNMRLIILCFWSTLRTVRLNKRIWLKACSQFYAILLKLLFPLTYLGAPLEFFFRIFLLLPLN